MDYLLPGHVCTLPCCLLPSLTTARTNPPQNPFFNAHLLAFLCPGPWPHTQGQHRAGLPLPSMPFTSSGGPAKGRNTFTHCLGTRSWWLLHCGLGSSPHVHMTPRVCMNTRDDPLSSGFLSRSQHQQRLLPWFLRLTRHTRQGTVVLLSGALLVCHKGPDGSQHTEPHKTHRNLLEVNQHEYQGSIAIVLDTCPFTGIPACPHKVGIPADDCGPHSLPAHGCFARRPLKTLWLHLQFPMGPPALKTWRTHRPMSNKCSMR